MENDGIVYKYDDGVTKINLQEEGAFRDWSTKFGISIDKLKRIIIEVGTNVRAIEKFLSKSEQS